MKAIFWDMDGTLVDSEPMHEAALLNALAASGITPPDDLHEHVVGMDARSVHAWAVERLGLPLALPEWLALKYETYLTLVPGLQGRPGALELFEALRAEGVAQAVVSNSDRIVVGVNLDAVGLTRPGLLTVSRNDVRRGKPDPEPYLRAAWLVGAEPGDCIAVEDSLTGAAAGIAAGMTTLFWPQSPMAAPAGATACATIDDLASAIRERIAA
ncbi:HAD family phosphatase [Paroceanicella profunda]|uniref:HAD family phosphatase n=1 Tax=Paroceanicella profunda TaxID=2579971 RepID=A0A5B8FSI7_9RHOB|nr:HAD family phosphatase [Paroceanicella profunda]QDL91736.1 HAD family phosphatase [Paroceanicella profunda]